MFDVSEDKGSSLNPWGFLTFRGKAEENSKTKETEVVAHEVGEKEWGVLETMRKKICILWSWKWTLSIAVDRSTKTRAELELIPGTLYLKYEMRLVLNLTCW